MRKFLLFSSILVLFLSVSSCSKSANDVQNEELSNKAFDVPTLKIDEIIAIGKNLTMNVSRNELISSSLTKSSDYCLIESEIRTSLKPLIDNGRLIRNDAISMIDMNNWWSEFTPDEIEAIRNFDDAQLAELSLILSNSNIDYQYTKAGSVGRCLVSALLGIGAGVEGYIGGTVGLITAKTAISIIKNLTKRSLGIFGVAWAVYDFVDCMND